MNELTKERRRVTKSLVAMIEPHLWASCYVDSSEANGRLMIYCMGTDKNNKAICYGINGYILTQFEGFVKDGVITDSYGGGLAQLSFDETPVEDLLKLEKYLIKHPQVFIRKDL